MSGGNVRAALGFIVSFVGSGHVDTDKIFDAIGRGGYTLPLHEFMRAVMYGEHEWFYPADSPIANVFDISRPDGAEHFLQSMLVAFVAHAGRSESSQGFVTTVSVYEFAQSLGFDVRQAAAALNRCASKSLIETSPRYIQEEVRGADSERCRVTTIGLYTIRTLVTEFSYLDAVCIDTPIVEPRWRAVIGNGQSFDARMERAENFRKYLDIQFEPFRSQDLPFDWDVLSSTAAQNMVHIRDRQKRRRQ